MCIRDRENSPPSGNWIAGAAATVMAGKYVYDTDLNNYYETDTTAIAAPQGVAGLDTTNLAYKALVNPQSNPSVDFSRYPAQTMCKNLGGRLPYLFELASMWANKNSYGNNFNTIYMSASEQTSPTTNEYIYWMSGGGGILAGLKTDSYPIRCVAD